jgi:hypothetical protein
VTFQEIEGAVAHPAERMAVEDLFCQSADQGLAGEVALITLLSLGENLGDMKWAWGGSKYILNNGHVRPALAGSRLRSQLAPAQSAQSAKLSFGRFSKDIEEIFAGSGRWGGVFRCH